MKDEIMLYGAGWPEDQTPAGIIKLIRPTGPYGMGPYRLNSEAGPKKGLSAGNPRNLDIPEKGTIVEIDFHSHLLKPTERRFLPWRDFL